VRQPSRVLIATLAVASLCAFGAAPAVPVAAAAPSLVTADAQPTWQTNGTVWTIEQVGGIVYVGGNFSSVRPPGAAPGTREVARDNVAAFDSRSGALLPFSHTFRATTYAFGTVKPDVACDIDYDNQTFTCDTVYKIRATPDGSSIIVGGDFTSVDGQPRSRMAEFPTAGADRANTRLDTGFVPAGITGRVRSLAVSNAAVYIGGTFGMVGGVQHERLAAVNRRTAAPLPFNATSDGEVLALALAGGGRRLIIGGQFNTINRVSHHAIAAVDPATGESTAWQWNGVPTSSFITDMTTDSDTVYVASNGEGSWDGRAAIDPMTGKLRWFDSCLGATWALTLMDGILYSGSHAHNCNDTLGGFPEAVRNQPNPRYYRLLAQTARGTTTTIQHWFPTTNGGDPQIPADQSPAKLGPRAMANDGRYLWVGGQFTTVNGVAQQGLTRFTASARSLAPARPAAPTATASGTSVTVTWKGVEDLDDAVLTYQLYRGSTLISSTRAAGKPWLLPTLTYTDKGASGNVQYSVRAVDGHGTASAVSPAASLTVGQATDQRTGQATGLATGPTNDQPTGNTGFSWDDPSTWERHWDGRGGWGTW
jgi:hypothetical protein